MHFSTCAHRDTFCGSQRQAERPFLRSAESRRSPLQPWCEGVTMAAEHSGTMPRSSRSISARLTPVHPQGRKKALWARCLGLLLCLTEQCRELEDRSKTVPRFATLGAEVFVPSTSIRKHRMRTSSGSGWCGYCHKPADDGAEWLWWQGERRWACSRCRQQWPT